MISPLLTTDEAVRCRTVATSWNEGSRYGLMGEMFFQLLHKDSFAKHWYYDGEGDKLCTLLKKRNPIMESLHKWGLQGSRVEASPSESGSFGEAVMSLVAEERIRQLFITWGHSEREGIDSMSSGSMSPDLGEMWRQGYPVMTVRTRMKITTASRRVTIADECDPKEYISEVREGSLRASLRDCLTPSDILVLRTAGSKWNNAKLYGNLLPCGSFSKKMEVSGPARALTIAPILVLVMVCSNQDGYQNLTAIGSSGEWT